MATQTPSDFVRQTKKAAATQAATAAANRDDATSAFTGSRTVAGRTAASKSVIAGRTRNANRQ